MKLSRFYRTCKTCDTYIHNNSGHKSYFKQLCKECYKKEEVEY